MFACAGTTAFPSQQAPESHVRLRRHNRAPEHLHGSHGLPPLRIELLAVSGEDCGLLLREFEGLLLHQGPELWISDLAAVQRHWGWLASYAEQEPTPPHV